MATAPKQTAEQAQHDAALLGYDPRWIDFGLVDAAYLRAQAESYEREHDEHTEHYRVRGFRDFFARCTSLSDARLAAYVQLVESAVLGQDPLGADPLYQLLRFPGLTDAQLEWLAAHEAFQVPGLVRLATRTRLLRRFARNPDDGSLVEPVIAAADTQLQRRIVEHPRTPRALLQRLAEDGASAAVRNLARSRIERGDTG